MTDQPAPLTPPASATEAQARLTSLVENKEWGAKLVAGDVAVTRQYRELLNKAAETDDSTIAAAMAGKVDYSAGTSTEQRHMALTADWFRSLGIRDEVARQFLQGRQVTPLEYELVSNWKKEQMGDPEFVKRFLAGDLKAKQQMMLADSVLVTGVKDDVAA
jgi:hypothetical protein